MQSKRKRLEKELEEAEEEQRLEDWLVINSALKCAPRKAKELQEEYQKIYGIPYSSNDFKYCDGIGWIKNV
jgi:hypothetical protein